MSEPVSNAEVEDVLASIRRLVSEEKRPSGTGAFDASKVSELLSDAKVDPRSKLVLTAALRVADPEKDLIEPSAFEQSEPVEEHSVSEEDHTNESSLADAEPESVLHEFVAELTEPASFMAAGSAAQTVEQTEERMEDAPFVHAEPDEDESARTFVFGRLTAEEGPEDTLDDGVQAADDDDKTQTIASTYLTAEEQEFDIGFDSAPDDDTADAGEPLESEDMTSEDATDDVEDEEDASYSDNAPVGYSAVVPSEGGVITPENLRPGIDVPISLSAKIAALEAVIGKRPDQWEPDGVDQDAYSGTEDPTMAWEDHAPGSEFYGPPEDDGTAPEALAPEEEILETEPLEVEVETDVEVLVDDAAEDEVEPAEAETFVDADEVDEVENIETAVIEEVVSSVEDEAAKSILAADVDVLDEDVLRDMVADIVRQELQGALGERITRNVRKLVRREIHRALATQDLE